MSSGTARRLRHAWLILAVVMLALAAAACDSDDERVSGSGVVVSESRAVREFNEIVVSDFGQVLVEVTGTETLEVEADDNLLPLLTSSVNGGRLELGVTSNTRLDPSSDVVYRVTAADLRALTVRGSGSVSASGIDTEKLTATIAGAGSITLAGRAQSVELRIPGAGTIDAAELVASAGSVQINGAGDVTVNATDTLDIAINGSGNVSYLGSPALDQSISGSGKVSRVGAGSSA